MPRINLLLLLLIAVPLPAPDALAQPEPRPRKPKQTTSQPAAKDGTKTLADEGRELFPEAARPDTTASSGAPASGPRAEPHWRIVLATVTGPDAESLAQQALWKVQNVAQLGEAYVIEHNPDPVKPPTQAKGSNRPDRSQSSPTPDAQARDTDSQTFLVCYGRYEGPTDPRALADLARVRDVRVGNDRPFAGASLVPPDDDERAITSSLDLRAVRASRDPKETLYTLAIGFYTRADMAKPSADELAEYRKLAEEAATKLRREGDEAYFYHGPNGSQVTLGVFTTRDYDPLGKDRTENPAIAALKKKYPNYLLNGLGQVRTVVNAQGWRKELVPSMLVEIPR